LGFIVRVRSINSQKVFSFLLIILMISLTSLSSLTLNTAALQEDRDLKNIDKGSEEPGPLPNDLQKEEDSDELTKMSQWDENLYNRLNLYVDGDYLYSTSFYDIAKFNISQPNNPILLGSYTSGDYYFNEFIVKNDIIYIRNSVDNFKILNVSNIDQVEEMSIINGTFSSRLLDITDDVLLLGNDEEVIFLYDITDPFSPTLIQTIELSNSTYSIQEFAVKDDILYVINGTGDFILYNITNPNIPELIGSYDSPIEDYNYNLQFNENYLYTHQQNNRISFINITDVYNPNYITSINLSSGNLHGCTIFDNILYVMNNTFLIYNITDITNPIYISAYSDVFVGTKLHIASNYAYAIEYHGKLKVLDIADAINPQLIATFEFGGFTSDISCEGNLAAIANNNGVLIFDISNKSAPKKLNQIDVQNAANIIMQNNFLYVISGLRSLEIYNIADIENPVLTGSYEGEHFWHMYVDFIIDGNYLILMIFGGGIEVINISDPSSPTHVSEHLLESFTSRDMILDKNYLYLLGVGPPGDIVIFDVSDYNNLVLFKILSITNIEGKEIFIEGKILYMLGYSELTDQDYIYYYKIKLGGNYQLDGYYNVGDYSVTDMIIDGNYIYLAAYQYGIVVFRKSSFNLFELYIPFTHNETSRKLVLHDGFLYLAAGYDGFVIYDAFVSTTNLQMLFIILGVVVGITVIVVAVLLFMRRRRRKELSKSQDEEDI